MKRVAPSAERNVAPIIGVLGRVVPESGTLLEIASGTGQHSFGFAQAFRSLVIQPSDLDPGNLASIEAWRAESGLDNFKAPITLDARQDVWPLDRADVIVNINMIHISEWAACEGLMAGASRVLPLGGILFMYGPYLLDGDRTAPSNLAFSESLQSRNPAWGVRALSAVVAEAGRNGLVHRQTVEMPANNLSLVFERAEANA